MILIERWLKGNRNFIVGKSLYAKFGHDKAVMQLLDKGETAFSKEALVKALEAIAATPSGGTAKHAEAVLMEMPKADIRSKSYGINIGRSKTIMTDDSHTMDI